jgi:hypothetical protein
MSKSLVFPYGVTLRDTGHIDIFPAAKVEFLDKEGEWFSLFLLVDSGATVSALPKSDAEVFGLDVGTGRPTPVFGIGERGLTGWWHEIPVLLGGYKLRLPILFLDSADAPRVLGRKGVFEQFTVVFEESRRRTGLIAEHTHAEQVIRKILDQV